MNRNLGVTELIRNNLPEWTVPVFETAALFGDELVVAGVVALFVAAGTYRATSRGADDLVPDRTAFVLAVVVGGLALTLILKTALGFSRPPSSLQAVSREGEGFPSGHTMAATILWSALAIWGARSTVRRRTAAAAVIIGVVAFSRLALGVHYLPDVLASMIVGVGYLFLAATLTEQEPARAFLGAVALGGIALVVTGGSTDGWLAFIGCAGGAAGWWASTRPRVRELWATVVQ